MGFEIEIETWKKLGNGGTKQKQKQSAGVWSGWIIILSKNWEADTLSLLSEKQLDLLSLLSSLQLMACNGLRCWLVVGFPVRCGGFLQWRCCGVAVVGYRCRRRLEVWSGNAKEWRLWHRGPCRWWLRWRWGLEEGCGKESSGGDVVEWCFVLFVGWFLSVEI